MAKSLYVGGLPYSTTKEAVRELFEGVGEVSTVRLIMDRETGQSKGFAFVDMADDASAQEAIAQLNGSQFGGRSLVVNEVRAAKAGQGLNVDSGEIVDMVKAGIIDPAMVTSSALQNAASIAKNILTTEAVVAEAPEKSPAPMGGGGGMPDMM